MIREEEIYRIVREIAADVLCDFASINDSNGKESPLAILNEEDLKDGDDPGVDANVNINANRVSRKSPWTGHRIGVIFPRLGRALMQRIGKFKFVNGTVWKKNHSLPPHEEGDFVERFPSHNQRVEKPNGKTIFKSKSFTIDVSSIPTESDSEASSSAGSQEIIIRGRSGSEVNITPSGDIHIKVGPSGRISIGSATAAGNQLKRAVRNGDISKKPITVGVPGNVQLLSTPVVWGSNKVYIE